MGCRVSGVGVGAVVDSEVEWNGMDGLSTAALAFTRDGHVVIDSDGTRTTLLYYYYLTSCNYCIVNALLYPCSLYPCLHITI
jgi:hypothetical protein